MFWQIILFLALLIPILAIVLDSQVGRALASRLERRSLEQPEDLEPPVQGVYHRQAAVEDARIGPEDLVPARAGVALHGVPGLAVKGGADDLQRKATQLEALVGA